MERDFVSFTLEGDPQEYKLCYDFNELADAELLTGCNLHVTFLGGAVSVNVFRGILYALLKTAHPYVTVKEAGGLMSSPENRKKILDLVGPMIGGEAEEEEREAESEVANG